MATYITSDWHFWHDKEFIWQARGFTNVEEMNEAIVERHNSIVLPDDEVYCLGDCGLGGAEHLDDVKQLIERMNGRLHLIRGNHDTDNRVSMYKTCSNVVECGNWADVIKYKKCHFYLSHFPTITSNVEKEHITQATLNLFGHTHQTAKNYENNPYMYHCGVDSNNCYPLLLDDIILEMKENMRARFEDL